MIFFRRVHNKKLFRRASTKYGNFVEKLKSFCSKIGAYRVIITYKQQANDNIQKILTGLGDEYTTSCLQDYFYFKEHYKLISIDLSKQQVVDAAPKAMHQISYTGNLKRDGNTQMFFVVKKAKKGFRFAKRNRKSILILFCFNMILT